MPKLKKKFNNKGVQTHELKVWPEFFAHTWRDDKPFEIRKNDRNFMVGDYVILQEWDPREKEYTGSSVTGEIIYITDFMQPQGYVVFSYAVIRREE